MTYARLPLWVRVLLSRWLCGECGVWLHYPEERHYGLCFDCETMPLEAA